MWFPVVHLVIFVLKCILVLLNSRFLKSRSSALVCQKHFKIMKYKTLFYFF